MRPSDIRQLRLDDVLWRRGLIAIRQAKTGRPLTLPLLPEIANALVAYLRDGRPQTDRAEIFIRHRAPFVPFVPTNNLTAIVRPIFRRTGLEQRSGGRGVERVSARAREPTARGRLSHQGDRRRARAPVDRYDDGIRDGRSGRAPPCGAVGSRGARMSTAATLLPVPPFSSPLAEALSRFLAFKRAAGCRYEDEARARAPPRSVPDHDPATPTTP